ncbi:MAG: translation initiation factor IF-2 [Candidatus Omnitrophica bacterium]|nr:translation initiation factor IF-2 [Candidatus Omnitrophota bacterium]
MSIKVKELASELGIKSEELMDFLKKLYLDIADENSPVEDKIAGLVRIKLGKGPEKKKKVPVKTAKVPKNKDVDLSLPEDDKGIPSKDTKKKSEKVQEEDKEASPKKPVEPVVETPVSKPEETMIVSAKDFDQQGPVKPMPRKMDRVIVVRSALDDPEEIARIKAEKDAKEAKEAKAQKDQKLPKDTKETAESKGQSEVKRIKLSPDAIKSIEPEEESVDGKRKITFGQKKFVKGGRGAHDSPFSHGPRKTRKVFKVFKEEKQSVAFEELKRFAGTDYQKVQLIMPTDIRSIAVKLNKRPNDLIQYLFTKGCLVNINQQLDEALVRDLLKDLGYELEITMTMEEDLMAEHHEQEKAYTVSRAPVVTFMGHVDHGKTSLLDYIRKTMVTKKEKGGITQHLGAYKVDTPRGSVTFLDTPGHEAFTAMRARGANATDIVVLVVAADDGVMPQTKEAIDHARAANVPIIVAINKCDLPGANPNKVKIGLQVENLTCEDFGGKTVMVKVSAKTGEGVNTLIEMLMLEAELLELKSNPEIRARGIVLDAKISAGQGVTTNVLVQNGTLRVGDVVLTGIYFGKIKAMINGTGDRISEALPSTPVEILGIQGVPEAGDTFYVVKDEKKAKTLSELKQQETRKNRIVGSQRVTLEQFHDMVIGGEIKELKIILKGDVQGSVQAIIKSLTELATDEVKVTFVHTMVGDINESDIMLAMVTNSVIIGFSVKVEPKAEALAKVENIDVRTYDIIYEAIEDIKAAMEGLLEPIEQEIVQGYAEVRAVFPSRNGKAAGCVVTRGIVHRKDKIKVKRNKEIIFTGSMDALKRFKDDVKEVREGTECGISLQGSNDIKEGDIIEAYIIEKIARRLEKTKK